MIELLGISLTYEGLLFFVLFLASEAIGLNPKLKDNTVLQAIVHFAHIAKYGRKEDDQIEEIRRVLRGGGR